MLRVFKPIVSYGVIVGLLGLAEGERAVIVPLGLMDYGILTQEFGDWIFDNEPLTQSTVIVVQAYNDRIVKYRANFECAFDDDMVSQSNEKDVLTELRPRHPNWAEN